MTEAWRQALEGLVGGRAEPAPAAAGLLALQLRVREVLPRTGQRWNGPTTRAATAGSPGPFRLGLRGAAATEKGWSAGAFTWNSLPHVRNRLQLDPAQHRWLGELGALLRAGLPAGAAHDPEWLYLDDVRNPLVWSMLRQAATLGIPLVGGRSGTVVLGGTAALTLDAVRRDDTVRIAPLLTIDGTRVPADRAEAVGDSGVWARGEGVDDVLLAPFPNPVDPALLRRDPTVVPLIALDELRDKWLPALQDRFVVTSSDASVTVPPPVPPTLVLLVRTEASGGATFSWRWEGLRGGGAPRFFDHLPESLLPEGWRHIPLGASTPEPRTLAADDAADLLFDVVPALRDRPGVRVERIGAAAPVLRTGDPVIDVSLEPGEGNDWFDLGVSVMVDGRRIPFGPLFRALASNRRRLKLVDGSFLSLAHPKLAALAGLIEEAADLPEWESGFVVPKSRAALWTAFEDVADSSSAAEEWRRMVRAIDAAPEPVQPPAGLRASLRPYQREGLAWLVFLYRHGLGGILADDMGLGKTLQCLALVQHAREEAERSAQPVRPFLVVAPASVASNWVAEAARFAPGLDVRLLRDRPDPEALTDAHLIVTTYTRLRLDADVFTRLARHGAFAGLLLDEAQAVKNAAARTHAVVADLGIAPTIAVTGTPLENSLTELHALLTVTAPGLFPSSRRFREQFVRPIEGLRAGYTEGVGAGNAPEANAAHRADRLQRLRNRIRPFVLRRTKQQVAPELPPVEEQVVQVDLAPAHRDLYDVFLQRERRKLFGLLPEMNRNRFIVLRSLTLLRLLALDAALLGEGHEGLGSAKLDVLADELTEAVAEGRRVLVFSQFPSYLRLVAERLDAEGIAWTMLEGSTRDRDAVIGDFRSGDAPVFLISLKAGGFGLNLTEADLVYLLDPWWNPQAERQAIDRTHRIGQDRPVTVRRLVAAGTIEEKVLALQTRKRDLFDAVMDDGDPFGAALTAEDVESLLA